VSFSDDDERTRKDAEQALTAAEHDREHYQRENARTVAQRDALVFQQGLATLSEAVVKELRDRTGNHNNAQGALPKRRAKLAEAEGQARQLLAGVFPDLDLAGAERRRPSEAALQRLRRLADRKPHFVARSQAAERAAPSSKASSRVSSASSLTTRAGRTSEHKRAVQLAQRGRYRSPRAAKRADAERLRALAESEHAALGLYRGPLGSVPTLALPSDETVLRFERELAQRSQRREALLSRRDDERGKLGRVLEQVAAIERSGAVPSETELDVARASRDRGYAQLLAAWRGGGSADEADPESRAGSSRARAFELLVQGADGAADALRREAKRVSELAQLRAEQAELERDLARLQSELAEAEAAELASERAWQRSWEAAASRPGPRRRCAPGWCVSARSRSACSNCSWRSESPQMRMQNARGFRRARSGSRPRPSGSRRTRDAGLDPLRGGARRIERSRGRARRETTSAGRPAAPMSEVLRDKAEADAEQHAWARIGGARSKRWGSITRSPRTKRRGRRVARQLVREDQRRRP